MPSPPAGPTTNTSPVVGYLVFELPAALALRLFPPNWVYGVAVIMFGVLATSMTAVRTYAPIMVIRLLLGLSEATIQTGFLFLTLWYRREEVTTRAGTYPMTSGPSPQLIEPSLLLSRDTCGRSHQRTDCVRSATKSGQQARKNFMGMVFFDRGCPHHRLGNPCPLILAQTSRDGGTQRQHSLPRSARTTTHPRPNDCCS